MQNVGVSNLGTLLLETFTPKYLHATTIRNCKKKNQKWPSNHLMNFFEAHDLETSKSLLFLQYDWNHIQLV